MRGHFITFEGGDGCGKSTQVAMLAQRLKLAGKEAVVTREPGGTQRAETIRALLLEGKAREMGNFAETLLFSLAREDHIEKLIAPALEKGEWVICDRFIDSTRAYQGAGGGIDENLINALERVVVEPYRPDITVILDVTPEEGLERARLRMEELGEEVPDRFEAEEVSFHQKLRDSFLEIARKEPNRCIVVNGMQPVGDIHQEIWNHVRTFAA